MVVEHGEVSFVVPVAIRDVVLIENLAEIFVIAKHYVFRDFRINSELSAVKL
jgi:hypothetical protein